ncbi:MAG: hypothetical protein EAY75_14635 [Bacteroidetes bacterium]|nr:MAG: hypothetical protein EAY75_14635 [Bacteroidota bacterium]
MQNPSPRKYFETRLRKLPIYKCMVNNEWEESKVAQVMVMRKHVNGNVSGSTFLVDLLCLGVVDATWFFNTDADKMAEMIEAAGMNWVEIPYVLAHNIVYAGLEFAEEYHIKPHADFATAKYALEEDDNAIELYDIATGEDGIPHLIETYPGQYADAHSKLKKYAGEGNYKVTLVERKGANDDEGDWGDEDEIENWEDEKEITLNAIPLGELTAHNTMMLASDEIFDSELFESRTDLEQLNIYAERVVRLYEEIAYLPRYASEIPGMNETVGIQIEHIKQMANEDAMSWTYLPNGSEMEDYEQGMTDYLNLEAKLPDFTVEEKRKHLDELLQSSGDINPLVLAQCVFYLLTTEYGPKLFETLTPHIHLNRHYPIVALAQSFLVTAEPENFPQLPLLNTNPSILKEVCTEYPSFSAEEYSIFCALRCLQALQQNNIPLMATWYRIMVETDQADFFTGMLAILQIKIMKGTVDFWEGLGEKQEKTELPDGESQK